MLLVPGAQNRFAISTPDEVLIQLSIHLYTFNAMAHSRWVMTIFWGNMKMHRMNRLLYFFVHVLDLVRLLQQSKRTWRSSLVYLSTHLFGLHRRACPEACDSPRRFYMSRGDAFEVFDARWRRRSSYTLFRP